MTWIRTQSHTQSFFVNKKPSLEKMLLHKKLLFQYAMSIKLTDRSK